MPTVSTSELANHSGNSRSGPVIIAHRALLNGPDKQIENRVETIRHAIAQGYDVEVDVWVKYLNGNKDIEWWLGHDGPQYKVQWSFLEEIAPRAYLHAKNGDALFEILQRAHSNPAVKCFSHDVDEYTITSNGKIWAYPGKKLFPSDSCICVMPERAPVQDGLSKCLGICTDFAEQFRIYQEMRVRQHAQVQNNQLTFDEEIQSGRVDKRLCVAAYTWFDGWMPSENWSTFLKDIKSEFSRQNVYDVARDAENVLHHTVIQLVGFGDYQVNVDKFSQRQQQYLEVLQEVIAPLMPFDITYRGATAIQSGLVLFGYPSIDVNVKIRTKLYEKYGMAGLYTRQYVNNIVHSTIVRLSRPEEGVNKRLLAIADKYQDTYFGTLKVAKFEVGHSSWRMQTSELKPVGSVVAKLTG